MQKKGAKASARLQAMLRSGWAQIGPGQEVSGLSRSWGGRAHSRWTGRGAASSRSIRKGPGGTARARHRLSSLGWAHRDEGRASTDRTQGREQATQGPRAVGKGQGPGSGGRVPPPLREGLLTPGRAGQGSRTVGSGDQRKSGRSKSHRPGLSRICEDRGWARGDESKPSPSARSCGGLRPWVAAGLQTSGSLLATGTGLSAVPGLGC